MPHEHSNRLGVLAQGCRTAGRLSKFQAATSILSEYHGNLVGTATHWDQEKFVTVSFLSLHHFNKRCICGLAYLQLCLWITLIIYCHVIYWNIYEIQAFFQSDFIIWRDTWIFYFFAIKEKEDTCHLFLLTVVASRTLVNVLLTHTHARTFNTKNVFFFYKQSAYLFKYKFNFFGAFWYKTLSVDYRLPARSQLAAVFLCSFSKTDNSPFFGSLWSFFFKCVILNQLCENFPPRHVHLLYTYLKCLN